MSANPADDSSICLIRPMHEADHPFVFATWLNNYAGSRFARKLDRNIYFFEEKRIATRLLQAATGLIASDPDRPDHIFGWIVGEPPAPDFAVVHYLFVKADFGELGIGRRLFREIVGDAPSVFYSHAPPVEGRPSRVRPGKKGLEAGEIIAKLCPKAIYNPYLAFGR